MKKLRSIVNIFASLSLFFGFMQTTYAQACGKGQPCKDPGYQCDTLSGQCVPKTHTRSGNGGCSTDDQCRTVPGRADWVCISGECVPPTPSGCDLVQCKKDKGKYALCVNNKCIVQCDPIKCEKDIPGGRCNESTGLCEGGGFGRGGDPIGIPPPPGTEGGGNPDGVPLFQGN